jgi:hypothetical protein
VDTAVAVVQEATSSKVDNVELHMQNHLAKPPRGYLSGFTKFNVYNNWFYSSGQGVT